MVALVQKLIYEIYSKQNFYAYQYFFDIEYLFYIKRYEFNIIVRWLIINII